LIAGEHNEARLIASAFSAHIPSETELIESLIAPASRSVGEQWAARQLRVYVERRACGIAHSLLGVHSAASTCVTGHPAAVATVGANRHTLPARMAAVALREDGWQVEEIVGPLPPHELTESVMERRLDLVVLTTTLADRHRGQMSTPAGRYPRAHWYTG
jgi:methanogenic corrinoid protein MtbC1